MRKTFLLLAAGVWGGWLPLAAQENPARERPENLVKNPGFEDAAAADGLPGGGWWLFETLGKTEAKLDRGVGHTGQASVRMHSGGEARCVLVSQKFEVVPGDGVKFQAWVRGAGLATTNSSAQAGISFRNRGGNIIQRAVFHQEPLTTEWSLISGTAVAPAESVSAEAHLGYTNWPGTIWFDDVFAGITNPVSLSLVEGAKPWPGAQQITVKVANRQSKEFHGSIDFNSRVIWHQPVTLAAQSSAEFKLPLTLNGVGQHDYQIILKDDAGNLPPQELQGKFRVTAPLALFPACPCYHLIGEGNGDTRVDARVNVNPAQRAGLKLLVELTDAAGRMLEKGSTDASSGGFAGLNVRVPVDQAAVFTVTAQLLNATGKVLAEEKTDVHVISAGTGKVMIGPDGFLRLDGAAEFPVGLYNGGHYEEMAQAGFNATHQYAVAYGEAVEPINANEAELKALLDKSRANGMRMMVELPRLAIEKARWEQVRRRIETFKHHPGLLCWGSEERVARGDAPPANLAALYSLIKKLDPDHPLVLGDSRDVIQKFQADRRDFFPDESMDAGIWWWYPIPLKEADGNGLNGAGNSAELLEPPSWLTTTHSKKPLWIAIQSYQKPSKDARFPTPEEYRCQAYLSIINGVKGLFFYIGFGQKDYLGKPAGLLNKPELAHWPYVQKLASELREFSPVILAPDPKTKATLTPADAPVETAWRKLDGKLYLIAANKSGKAQKVKFTADAIKSRSARVLFEERAIAVEGDSLADEFSGFGVHIYELAQSP